MSDLTGCEAVEVRRSTASMPYRIGRDADLVDEPDPQQLGSEVCAVERTAQDGFVHALQRVDAKRLPCFNLVPDGSIRVGYELTGAVEI